MRDATKVGDTISAITDPENATNVASYQWYMGTKADAVNNAITGETTKTLTVTSSMMDNYLKVVVTDADGKTFESPVTTEAVTTTELALKSVEAATAGTFNVVIAYFNQEVESLDPSEVQIRRVSDDQLFSVEKVVVAADKKSATLTLTNTSAAGANVTGLSPNVDYRLSVTKNGKSASKVFSIPATITEALVYGVDPVKKTISVEQQHWSVANAAFDGQSGTFAVPDSIPVDYEALLGTTITVQYDKNNTITKLSEGTDKVVFGAFKIDSTKKTLTDLATGTVYGMQVASGAQCRARFETRAAKGATSGITLNSGVAEDLSAALVADGYIAFAKLAVNGSNQVKFAITQNAWTDYIKVGEVKNDSVIDGKTEISLKDYVIIKDGKTVKTSDLVAGDVVYYSTANSFAEVFNNEVTGTLDAVYTGSIKVDGKEYALKGTDANITFNTKHSVKDAAEATVDNDFLNALKASGEQVTVRLNRANQAVFLDGTTAEVKSSTKSVVLTDVAKYYTQSLSEFIRIKGFDGTAVNTYDINVSDLTKFTLSTGKEAKIGEAYPGKAQKIAKFKFTGAAPDCSIESVDSTGAVIAANDITASIKADMIAGELVTLTFNDKDKVIGIGFPAAVTGAADARFGSAAVNTAAAAVALTGTAADGKFRAGYTSLNGLQLAGTCPLYIYDSVKGTVEATTYGAFSGAEKTAGSNGIRLYTTDGKNVSSIVVDKSALDSDSDGITTTEGIVVRAKYDTSADKKLSEFAILVGSEVKEYTKFSGTITTALNAGDIVAVKVLKDGVTVSGFDQTAATIGTTVTGTITVTQASTNTFKIGNNGPYNMATVGTVQYGKLEDGALTSVDLATIIKEGASNEVVATTTGSANYIDSIVVKMGTKTKAIEEAETAVSSALANLSAVMTADGAPGHVTGTTDQVDNAGDYALVKAAYDNVTAMYEQWKSVSGLTTALATKFAADPNVGDYATAATEMDAWKGVEATIDALALTVNNKANISLPLKGTNSPLGVATGIAWAETDGADANATIGAGDTNAKPATVAIAAGHIGTFKLVATVTNGNSNFDVAYAVLCGEAGTSTNTIQSVEKIVDVTKYNSAQTNATEANVTPAAFTYATTGTSSLIKSVVQAKAEGVAALAAVGVTVDTSGLKLYEATGDTVKAEPANAANDYWAGTVVIKGSGYVTTVEITKADNWKMTA